MGNFNKDIYMNGCHLVIKLYGDTQNMYQFVFNPDTAEFSDIYSYEDGLEFEIEEDGAYSVVTIKNPIAELVDNGLQIGSRVYSAQELTEIISLENQIIEIGEWDLDSTFSICKLKKCLANLELKTFQELLKNCGKMNCKNGDDVKSQRDFLFIAVWLIEHYIELGNIEMAKSIYDRLKGCGNLCQDLLNDKRSCGCNG